MKTTTNISTAVLIAVILFSPLLWRGAGGEAFAQANQQISFRENLGQVCDQNSMPRPDVLFSGTDGQLVYHLKNNGISYQLSKSLSPPSTSIRMGFPSSSESGVDTSIISNKQIPPTSPSMRMSGAESPLSFGEGSGERPDSLLIYRLDVNWLNSNPNPAIKKSEPVQGYDNFYLAHCPEGVTHVKSYQTITYRQIYDGIDLKWYENEGSLKYDYMVAAHADYKQIQLEVKGAEKITINSKGELVIKTPLGDIIEQAPLVKQGGRQIPSKWVVKNNLVTFNIQGINPEQAFTIDPAVRVWGTYYGGNGDIMAYSDLPVSCATDNDNNVYLSGYTSSLTGIASTGSFQQSFIDSYGYNSFLAKFNTLGVRQWATYYGTGDDHMSHCTTDVFGNVYLTGMSNHEGMATTGSHQPMNGGGRDDAWLAKFDSSGIRRWATYYGGYGIDGGTSCATDPVTGAVYLAGGTYSETEIATYDYDNEGHQRVFGGGSLDAFLAKFDSAGVRQWATYYGGAGEDIGYSCATDTLGNVYLAGLTESDTGIATTGSHQPLFGGGNADAFLAKFDSAGVRQWATYYGGVGVGKEGGYSCATDASGNVYLAGLTASNTGTIIATTGSHQPVFGGNTDAFLAKFNATGVRQWATYYGGAGEDVGLSCATDTSGNVYLAGSTTSNTGTIIATAASHQPAFGGGYSDAFLAKFNAAGIRQWATYYGGRGKGADTLNFEFGSSCATDISGNVYLAGRTISDNGTVIATIGSHQPAHSGLRAFYLVKFGDCITPITAGITATDADCGVSNGSATASVSGGSGNPAYIWLPSGGYDSVANNLGRGMYTLLVISGACTDTATVLIRNGVNNLTADAGQPDTICQGAGTSVGTNGDTSYVYSWQPAIELSCSNCSNPVAMPDTSVIYRLIVTDNTGCSDTGFVAITVMPKPLVFAGSDTTIKTGDSLTLIAVGNKSYLYNWNTGETADSVTVAPLFTTTYYVAVTDSNGCIGSDSVRVVVYIPCEGEVFVPTAFSPNNDGSNELECLLEAHCIQTFRFLIYDRWGNNVFETSDPTICWDGTYKGEAMNTAVFAYYLAGTLTNGNVLSQKGNISLVR